MNEVELIPGASEPGEYGGTILRFTAQNFMRLEFVDITPRPVGVIPVCGMNGAGKTSLLDCIEWALRGGVALPDVPIRDGQIRALTSIQLGDLEISRVAKTGGAPKVRVSAKGVEQGRPQELLNRVVSEKTLDPLAFDRAEPRVQREAIIELRGLGPRLAANRAAREKQVSARTAARQRSGEIERQIAEIGPIPDGLPLEPIPATNAAAAMEQAAAAARENATRRARFAQMERAANDSRSEVDAIGREIEELRRAIEAAHNRQADAARRAEEQARAVEAERVEVAALKEPDSATFAAELQRITETNAHIERRARREKLRVDLRAAGDALDTGERAIAALDDELTKLLGSDGMPVPGLGFSEDGVLFNGRPLQQACGEERLRVSLAIAMATNPRARVILIRDGSLLDSKAMKLLHETAIAKGYQIWIERVTDTADNGILIEDGRVATIDGKAPESAPTAQASGE